MTTTALDAIKSNIEAAEKDYDAFLFGLSFFERELTIALTDGISDDAIVVNNSDIWLFQLDDDGNVCPQFLGHTKDLVLFVSKENTSLNDEDQLDFFERKLRGAVGSAIQVVFSNKVAAEWLRTNEHIAAAWDEALQAASNW